MDIIFIRLHRYMAWPAFLFQRLGYHVYYLKLSGDGNPTKQEIWAESLKLHNILPLPLEDIQHYYDFSEIYFDTGGKVSETTGQIAPPEFVQCFESLFPGIKNAGLKLRNIIHQSVAVEMMEITGKINLWANEHTECSHLVIDVGSSTLMAPKFATNVRLLVVPLELFTDFFRSFFSQLMTNIFIFQHIRFRKNKKKPVSRPSPQTRTDFQVMFVTHQGLKFGNLYKKDLFYSDSPDSPLYPEKLLHVDYSGYPSPSKTLSWICMGNHRESWWRNLASASRIMLKGIFRIRSFRQVLGLILLARTYLVYRSFLVKLENYHDLQLALIDYEVLCPKELILALETRGVRTLAAQERFILSFERMWVSIILDYYLCASRYAADVMKQTTLNCVGTYIPVGQYRSDNLIKNKQDHPPKILEAPRTKGCRIITALGFHTYTEWYSAKIDPGLNWKSHRLFLKDMIQLSKDLENVFIVLRYKDTNWTTLSVFADLIEIIKTSGNIMISDDYEKFNYSYELCAHSDLIVAKHTSIADECLSVGIPVLFHEYTHNTKKFMADSYDYSPTRVMCFNYQDLLERAKIILSSTPNAMSEEYHYLREVVYGGLSDGKVKQRIHAQIDEILSEITNSANNQKADLEQ